jgi:hypothetical protein
VTRSFDIHGAIGDEYGALADLLESAGPGVWDQPSLCEKWRTREVVAHVTMPVRYDAPAFMAELEAAGGDFRHGTVDCLSMHSSPTSAPRSCTGGSRRGAGRRVR